VEAADAQPGWVPAVLDLRLVERALEAVLGREQHLQLDALGGEQQVDDAAAVGAAPGVVRDQAELAAAQRREVLGGEDVEAGAHRPDGLRDGRGGEQGAEGEGSHREGMARTRRSAARPAARVVDEPTSAYQGHATGVPKATQDTTAVPITMPVSAARWPTRDQVPSRKTPRMIPV